MLELTAKQSSGANLRLAHVNRTAQGFGAQSGSPASGWPHGGRRAFALSGYPPSIHREGVLPMPDLAGSKARFERMLAVLAGLFFLTVLCLMLFAQNSLSAYYSQPALLPNLLLLPAALALLATAALLRGLAARLPRHIRWGAAGVVFSAAACAPAAFYAQRVVLPGV